MIVNECEILDIPGKPFTALWLDGNWNEIPGRSFVVDGYEYRFTTPLFAGIDADEEPHNVIYIEGKHDFTGKELEFSSLEDRG